MTLDRSSLRGFVPALVTPFDASGRIIEADFTTIAERMVATGATSLCVAGDNGESWALSAAERGRLTRLAVDAARGRAGVMVGCSAPTLDAALGYARTAAENGADALLTMPATYVLKGSRDEILRRIESVAKAVPLPIVLYNSPRRVGYGLTLDDVDAITNVAPVIGIKESDRDFFHHSHLLHRFRDRLAVMIGPCHYILPGIALGAAGFIATGPELLGPDAADLMAVGRQRPDERFAALHHRLTGIYEILMTLGTWPSALKAALALVGLPAGLPRDPVMPLPPAAIERLRARLVELGVTLA